ncbi:MAG: esterase, partial [Lachnospiraceae bacterium]|nr:esterase [Lachnospiraceae bacterium]
SVWFPDFVSFCKERNILTQNVYLSLGDKEHKTRNSEMAKVKDSIEEIYKDLQEKEVNCVLEYNPGNHFKDVGERIKKGLSWILRKDYLK